MMQDDEQPTTRVWAACLAIVLVLLTILALAFAWSIRRAAGAAPVPTTTTTTTVPPTTISLPPVAPASEPAVRMSLPPTTTTVPFDCASYVNSLTYEWMNLSPVHDAYRVTAQCLGWPLETIDKWEDFIVEDVIRNESGGCWNLRRRVSES